MLSHGEYKTLLWENQNPTNTFAAQTLSFDLSNYDMVEIHAFVSTQAGWRHEVCTRVHVGKTGAFIGIKTFATATDTTTGIQRAFVVSNTGISFANGIYRAITAKTLSQGNDVYVPLYIYGVKLGGGAISS